MTFEQLQEALLFFDLLSIGGLDEDHFPVSTHSRDSQMDVTELDPDNKHQYRIEGHRFPMNREEYRLHKYYYGNKPDHRYKKLFMNRRVRIPAYNIHANGFEGPLEDPFREERQELCNAGLATSYKRLREKFTLPCLNAIVCTAELAARTGSGRLTAYEGEDQETWREALRLAEEHGAQLKEQFPNIFRRLTCSPAPVPDLPLADLLVI